ncbi:MAG: glycosyltransferase family 4 protein [Deltaproteobacteria bacterium]|nr:glycosyltransferase family 4 protein [Deltaproteobacteria bacterium]
MFLSSCVRGGGAGWSLYYILKYLDRSRIEPLVVVPDRGIFSDRFSALGLQVHVPRGLPERTAQQRFARHNRMTSAASYALNLLDSAALAPRLSRLIRDASVDLVYCNNMMVKPIGALAAQLAGVPCVLHARNLHERPAKVLLYCQCVARLPAVKRVIANSVATAAPYRSAVPHKVSVVYNGIDLSEYDARSCERGTFRASLGFAPNASLIGFTGNLIPRKGVDILIRAIARAWPKYPDLQLVLVGQVPVGETQDHRAHYEVLAGKLGIADRVRFVGFVPDVRSAVRDFDILVLPSLQEPFGRSVIEAMALGTPVVASRVGGIPEIIEHKRDGLLVTPGNAQELAHALELLLDNAGLRFRLAESARIKVATKFNVAVLTQEIVHLSLAAARVESAPALNH